MLKQLLRLILQGSSRKMLRPAYKLVQLQKKSKT